jgi:hypothetical protein
MCLEKISEKRIAEEDITVYKFLSMSKTLKGPYVVSGNDCVAIISGQKVVGKISIDESGAIFICHNYEDFDGSTADNLLGFRYSWMIDKDVTSVEVNHVELISKSLTTPFRYSPVEIGKTYESELEVCGDTIEKGLHSFKKVVRPYYKDNAIFVKCIIPKGSKYYEGLFNDRISYASNKLTYLEIIE